MLCYPKKVHIILKKITKSLCELKAWVFKRSCYGITSSKREEHICINNIHETDISVSAITFVDKENKNLEYVSTKGEQRLNKQYSHFSDNQIQLYLQSTKMHLKQPKTS